MYKQGMFYKPKCRSNDGRQLEMNINRLKVALRYWMCVRSNNAGSPSVGTTGHVEMAHRRLKGIWSEVIVYEETAYSTDCYLIRNGRKLLGSTSEDSI